ncbi:Toxic anion resistance protein (TelA) [Rhizobium leguminosarum]|uniref:Toxic anion resistance protein (TelA) n=1 Tax=Rhizobium leguminosarum TaxID=384 RepID=UPI00102FF16A|nr:Toxic anion resistance protein (TelA) [Rhizobium leguminosarum]TAY89723.1 Toxic anion resistance protein (TelA) [Rhizobium leguminosarum]
MPTLSTGNLPAVVTVVLPPEKAGEVSDLAERFRLATVEPHGLITFGQEAIGGFGAKLDAILSQITNAQSPVLFELFRTIRDGVNDADLKGLEASIRPMEVQIEEESGKLILEVSRMSTLAQGYRDTIVSLGVFVEAGRRIVADAGRELDRLTKEAASGDPLKVQEARDFSQKLDIFQNRVLVLETAYAKAPADLDSIGIARGAALATLADTVTSANAEFNDIKSILIRLHALFQMQSIQQMNAMRRELRASLQQYGSQVLEDVSVNAVKAAGETRLADADLVLSTAQRLRDIADKVVAEGERNKERYAAARVKLEQARQIVTDRPI